MGNSGSDGGGHSARRDLNESIDPDFLINALNKKIGVYCLIRRVAPGEPFPEPTPIHPPHEGRTCLGEYTGQKSGNIFPPER